jgi:hypothetical protein
MRVTDASQLVGGPAATGQVGDFILYNDVIKVVISDIPRAFGFARSGGNIIDADRVIGGNDQLSQMFTYLNNTFQRQLIYDRLYVTRNGADGQGAEIVVTGADSRNPSLVGITRYQLDPQVPYVRIITEVTNQGGDLVKSYDVGDSLQWGLAEHYVPGYGTAVSGKSTQSPWVAGVGSQVSYGLAALNVTLAGPHGNGWSDLNGGRVNLARGGKVIYERHLIVGDGDTESIATVAFKLRDDDVHETVKGRAVELQTRKPVAGARIEARNPGGKPMGFAVTDSQGRFSLTLPPSEYKLQATHRARGARQPVSVDLTRGKPSDVALELTAPAKLLFRVEEPEKGPIPCKLTFVGLDGTPNPELGHKSQAPGALNTWFSLTGKGEIEVPPGRYQITVSRGIEYGIRQENLTLGAGEEQVLAVNLPHEVDTGAYLSADLNQHTSNSTTSWVRPDDAILANLAEGIEIFAATDTDFVSDFLPLMQNLGLESRLKIVSGQEIVTREFGSIVAFPVEPRPDRPGNGALAAGAKTPAELFEALRADGEARVIQVNQPREGQEGYFNLLELDPQSGIPGDPRFSFGFNTLEVFTGKRMKDGSAVLRDWFLLLNKGYVFTATGNSDSRTIVTQERGYPRNFLGIYSDNPGRISDQEVVSAVRDRHDVIVTNGPFIRAAINGSGRVGSQISAPAKPGEAASVNLELEVQAPTWIRVEEIEVVANGEVVRRIEAPTPDAVVKFKGTIDLHPTRDTWYVVIARGSQSMEPVVPQYKGTTITPFGFTNPIWVDVDGDKKFEALFPRDPGETGYIELPLEQVE